MHIYIYIYIYIYMKRKFIIHPKVYPMTKIKLKLSKYTLYKLFILILI